MILDQDLVQAINFDLRDHFCDLSTYRNDQDLDQDHLKIRSRSDQAPECELRSREDHDRKLKII